MGRGKHSSYGGEDYSFNSNYESRFESKSEPKFEPKLEDSEVSFLEEEEFPKKKIIIIISIILVIIIAIFAIYKIFFDKPEETVTEEPAITEEKMAERVAGYQVLGKIVIKDLNVEQYILNSTEEEALKNGVGKLYGATLNNYGNFCIAGHNYENVFKDLTEMEVGDEFIIVDKNLEETTYEIKEIYTAEPDDLKCLMQNEDKIEMTLITCESGATTRLIVKAEEKSNVKYNTNENVTNTVSDAKENV